MHQQRIYSNSKGAHKTTALQRFYDVIVLRGGRDHGFQLKSWQRVGNVGGIITAAMLAAILAAAAAAAAGTQTMTSKSDRLGGGNEPPQTEQRYDLRTPPPPARQDVSLFL